MRKVIGLALALLIVCGFSGCGGANTPDDVMKATIDNMKELGSIMEGIKDEASGEAAIPKVEAVAKRMKELKEKMKSFKLSDEEMKKLGEKYLKDLMEVGLKMMAPQMKAKLAAPNAMKKIDALMKDVQ